MDGDGDLSELAFCIAGYEKNIKAFSQNYNPQLKMVPGTVKQPNYKNPELQCLPVRTVRLRVPGEAWVNGSPPNRQPIG
jgi:hypothetical protein